MSTSAADWFERTFGAPLPFPLPELVQTPNTTHWATHPALTPHALMVPAFPDDPPAYTVLGHWGHGIGSQAFYFIRRDPQHRCFLRVGFGGPYDPEERRKEIVEALTLYRDLLELPLRATEIVYSIGTGHASLTSDRETIEFDTWKATTGIGAPAPTVDSFLRYVLARGRSV